MSHITEFKNRYVGKKLFIIGNGPSLNKTPLTQLQDEYTFATNRISKKYPETDWRPTFYSYMRSEIPSRDFQEDIKKNVNEDTICFINNDFQNYFGDDENIYYLSQEAYNDDGIALLMRDDDPDDINYPKNMWSDDISSIVYSYNSSLYPIFQIAHYMGFDEIYLVGCDLGMDFNNHMIFENAPDPLLHFKYYDDNTAESILKYIRQSGNPVYACINMFSLFVYYIMKKDSYLYQHIQPYFTHHFSDSYEDSLSFKKGEDIRMIRCHKLAKEYLDRRSIDVYNATIGGQLEIYPRKDIFNIIDRDTNI